MKKTIHFCIMILFMSICIGCSNQNNQVEENKAIAKQFIEAWDNHDSVKVASLYSDNFIYQDMTFGFKISNNKNELIRFVNGTIKGVPDLHFKVNSVIASDSISSIEWTWTGTFSGGWGENYPANNKSFAIQGVTVMNIKNGLITFSKDYYDNKPFRKVVALQ